MVTHCYIRLLYSRIIHLILQAASGPCIICDIRKEVSLIMVLFFGITDALKQKSQKGLFSIKALKALKYIYLILIPLHISSMYYGNQHFVVGASVSK